MQHTHTHTVKNLGIHTDKKNSSLSESLSDRRRSMVDLVFVQEIRWEKEGAVREGDDTFVYGTVQANH